MQVTITRTIQVPYKVESINELEGVIPDFGRSVMSEVLADTFELYQRTDLRCDSCGSEAITQQTANRLSCSLCSVE
jgi:hypothetical protein